MTCLHKILFCLAVVSGTLSLVEAAADCSSSDGFKCDSCSTLALCSGGSVTNAFQCQSSELCEEGPDGTASCMLTTETRTNCQCSSFPSYVADSYDTQKYLLCFSSTLQLSLTCPSGEQFDEVTSRCEPIPPTTAVTTTPATTEPTVSCSEEGLFPLLPSCSGYYGCFSTGISLMSTGIVYCISPQVFNPDTLSCVESIPTPEAPPCGENDIVVADNVECNAFYVCNGGQVLGEKICCGEGQVFNSVSAICEADTGSVTCPTENPCFIGDLEKKCLPPSC